MENAKTSVIDTKDKVVDASGKAFETAQQHGGAALETAQQLGKDGAKAVGDFVNKKEEPKGNVVGDAFNKAKGMFTSS